MNTKTNAILIFKITKPHISWPALKVYNTKHSVHHTIGYRQQIRSISIIKQYVHFSATAAVVSSDPPKSSPRMSSWGIRSRELGFRTEEGRPWWMEPVWGGGTAGHPLLTDVTCSTSMSRGPLEKSCQKISSHSIRVWGRSCSYTSSNRTLQKTKVNPFLFYSM